MQISYNDFVTRYYSEAWDVADKTVRTVIKNSGFKDPRIDYELVMSDGVVSALEKVYMHFDIDRQGEGGLKSFLATCVKNSVLSALEKSIRANKREENLLVPKKKRQKPDGENKADAEERKYSHINPLAPVRSSSMPAHDYMEYQGWADRKEDLLKQMQDCLKKMQFQDQVILNAFAAFGRVGYVDQVIEELGMPDNDSSRNTIRIRLSRALKTMQKLMEGSDVAYRDICIPNAIPSGAKKTTAPSSPLLVDRNTVRRRRYAVRKEYARKIDYASLAEKMYRSITEGESEA